MMPFFLNIGGTCHVFCHKKLFLKHILCYTQPWNVNVNINTCNDGCYTHHLTFCKLQSHLYALWNIFECKE